MSAHENIIEVRGLRTGFGDVIIHDKLDLDVRRGEILGVVGGSGTGKSVLMRTIIGLNPARAGSIHMLGEDVLAMQDEERRAVEQRFGVLFQDGALFSSMTVAQNVMAPLREHLDISDQLAGEVAALKISLAGLPMEAGAKYPSELSGGMRKRAGLARAMALDPDVVFLDEPTAGLDPIAAAKFDELILSLRDYLGLTVFMITHDLDSLHRDCDRIAVLAEKRVIATAPMEEVSGPRGRAALGSAVKTESNILS